MNKEIINDIISWDIVNWSKALEFWNKNIDIKDKNYKCLELGARQGGLSLWLALQGNQVICSDTSYELEPNEFKKTKDLHHKHRCSDKISYEYIDALNIPYENTFDIVVFKSVLGGIGIGKNGDIEQAVINQIYKALKPDGKLVFIENLEASPLHMYLRKKFVGWGSKWNYLKFDYLVSLFSNFKSLNYKTVGFFGAFGKTESQRQLFGHIDTYFDRIVPKSKRYIFIGIAKKQ